VSEITYIYALHDPRDWAIVYVGKSNRPEKRLQEHHRIPEKGVKDLIADLQNAGLWLQQTILQRCNQSEWIFWERFWIAVARNAGCRLLNLSDGGTGPSFQTEEARKKISIAQTGRKQSRKQVEKTRTANLGKKRTAETRAKISAAKKGKKSSEKTKLILSAAHAGRKHTAETKAKMSAWQKGIKRAPLSEQCKQRLSAALKGRRFTPEHLANLQAASDRRHYGN
jgi:group I intron endonuclease